MTVRILIGDALERLKELPDESVHCCVTSPPYWGLRDYGVSGQIGLEPTPDLYVQRIVEVFREVRRVLRKDGTLWLNLGDSYCGSGKGGNPEGSPWAGFVGNKDRETAAKVNGGKIKLDGLKPKDLIGIPWMVTVALRADGWWLRSDIIWAKPNPMPESVTDRPTSAHEHVFLLAKSERYYFDADAVRESGSDPRPFHEDTRGNGKDSLNRGRASRQATGPSGFGADGTRNIRNVWTIATQPFPEAHFATFPPELAERCIKAGTSEKGCCASCGAPWKRQVKKSRTFESGSGRSGNMPLGKNGKRLQGGGETLDIRRGPCVSTETLGWEPPCSCGSSPIPCTVFDPFAGAGTTGLVAERLGRDAILIELNPEYAEMARERCQSDAPMFAAVELRA